MESSELFLSWTGHLGSGDWKFVVCKRCVQMAGSQMGFVDFEVELFEICFV